MTIRQDSSHYSSHVVAATLVSFWLTVYQAHAQSRETAFGQIRSSAVPGRVERFSLGTKDGASPVFVFWSNRGTVLTTATLDSMDRPTAWKNHVLDAPVDDFMMVSFYPEDRQVGVAVERNERRLEFFTNLEGDTLHAVSTVQLPITPARVVFGDLNNDKKTDFVVFDRENPGALPYFGLGNERFRAGKPLAPDNAIGDLQLAQLNNDGVLDIVLYDWVRSELHLLYGVGGGQFLDQASYPVDAEVRNFLVTPLGPTGKLDIVLSCRHPEKVEIMQGDGLGDFNLTYRIPLRGPLVDLQVADVNHDGYRDIVGLDAASTLRVYLNGWDGTFDERLDHVAGRNVTSFALVTPPGDSLVDAVLFDRGAQRVVTLSNAQRSNNLTDSLEFSVGVRPRGVAIADLNGDSLKDVTVVTGGSNAISFYMNRCDLGLQGQVTYSLPGSAHDLVFHSVVDSSARFLISYPDSRQVSLFTLDDRDLMGTNATISTERAAEFLYWSSAKSPSIDFFCVSPASAGIPAALTLFQEIGSHQFIERSFRLPASNVLLGAGVGHLGPDALADVAYVYKNTPTGKFDLAVAPGDSSYSFKQRTVTLELPEKNLTRSYVWVADLSPSSLSDIVLLNVGNGSTLVRVHPVRESGMAKPDTIALEARISDWSQVQFTDLDGDATQDIILNDSARREIGWYRNTGEGFEAFRPLCDAPPGSHFALGDLNNDGVPDIAVTLPERGVLKLYDGSLLLRRRMQHAQ